MPEDVYSVHKVKRGSKVVTTESIHEMDLNDEPNMVMIPQGAKGTVVGVEAHRAVTKTLGVFPRHWDYYIVEFGSKKVKAYPSQLASVLVPYIQSESS